MFELDQIGNELSPYEDKLKDMGKLLGVEEAKEKIAELEEISADPEFWNDMAKSQKTMQTIKGLKDKVNGYENLVSKYEDIYTLIEMGQEEEDADILEEVKQESEEFKENYEKLRIATLLDGEYDRNNAIVTLHAGEGGTEACDWVSMLYRMYTRWANKKGFSLETLDYLDGRNNAIVTLHAGEGGTEACDWVSMLYRMYTRWANKKGFSLETLDYLDGDEAGIKSVTFQVNGENAYGYLKCEKGVHRLVRVSPFDSSGRRHTSFASCDVMPEIDDDVEIEIKPDDIRVDTYRASGAGGQHVNKTSSAIRITHYPTGVVVQCQNERSQFSNKDMAMRMLKSKLLELKIEENMKKLAEIRGDVKENTWGSQIRSYVFMPYNLVKDVRTGEETANVSAVMDGEIDRFINAYLSWIH